MTISDTARAAGKALLDDAESRAAALVEAARKAVRRGPPADPEATDEAIAARFGCAHSYVTRLFTATSGVNITLGKVLALHPRLAREILVRALAAVDEAGAAPTTRDTLDAVAVDLGVGVADYARDLRDGREDEGVTHEANLTRIATAALRGIRGIQKRRAEAAR